MCKAMTTVDNVDGNDEQQQTVIVNDEKRSSNKYIYTHKQRFCNNNNIWFRYLFKLHQWQMTTYALRILNKQ